MNEYPNSLLTKHKHTERNNGMPNKIADDKAKIVYNEYRDTIDSLHLIAKRRRCSISDLLREAALEFVEKHEYTV